MLIRRTTTVGAANGHRPAWYTWYKRVMLVCPNGHVAQLNHEIAKDGTVTPSVECPEPGCDFHQMVTLEDWDPNAT